MPSFPIRLIEETIEEGHADFAIVAETPEAAAALLNASYAQARQDGSNVVSLPDGQLKFIERDVLVSRKASFVLLDDTGTPVRPLVALRP